MYLLAMLYIGTYIDNNIIILIINRKYLHNHGIHMII